jgi:NAD(P)-dependent dehydrogenase (short-subunit alcohol dehydrogenase family)
MNNNYDFSGQVAIVTGASSGLGLAIAKNFELFGAQVIYSDINDLNLNLDPKKSIFKKSDVSKIEEVKDLVETAFSKFGRLDIMVNNAGIGALGGILETSQTDWQKVLDINLSGVFYGTQAAAKLMKEHKIKGSIINLSSILGTVGLNSALAYCASKGGVVQLSRAASLDLASFGIRVNVIAPGFIKTKMTEDILKDDNFSNMVKSNTPLGYPGQDEDIAQAALYLASSNSSYVTGTVLHVDGGWTAR